MKITELLTHMASETDLTRAQAREALDAVARIFSYKFSHGERCELPGLGSFTVTERPERPGRNPATGEALTIPANRGVKFKAAKALRDMINPVRLVPRHHQSDKTASVRAQAE
jgi:DNA-binding protein HU-beta